MYIEKQINGYCDIAELILWLDANIKTMNYARRKTNPDSEDINYDILLQKLRESRYLNIHSFEEAFNDLQDFFSSREICLEPKPMNPDEELKLSIDDAIEGIDRYIENGGYKNIECKLPSIIATERTVIDNYTPVNVYPYYIDSNVEGGKVYKQFKDLDEMMSYREKYKNDRFQIDMTFSLCESNGFVTRDVKESEYKHITMFNISGTVLYNFCQFITGKVCESMKYIKSIYDDGECSIMPSNCSMLHIDVLRLQDNILVLNNYGVKLTNKCVKDILRRYK